MNPSEAQTPEGDGQSVLWSEAGSIPIWGDLERKALGTELWTQLKFLGSFERSAQAAPELDGINYDDLVKLLEDPGVAARFEQIRENSEARIKQWADAYAAHQAPTAGTTPYDREQQQAALTPQHPGHSPRR